MRAIPTVSASISGGFGFSGSSVQLTTTTGFSVAVITTAAGSYGVDWSYTASAEL